MGAAVVAVALSVTLGALLCRTVRRTLGAEPETINASLARMAAGDLASASARDDVPPGSVADAMHRMCERIAAAAQSSALSRQLVEALSAFRAAHAPA